MRPRAAAAARRAAQIPVVATPSKAPPTETVEIVPWEEAPQGSDEWHRLRLGMPTASVFGTIMAQGTDGERSLTRTKLLYRLAGEILTGEVSESYQNDAMRRGNDMEPEAISDFEFTHSTEVERVSFVRLRIVDKLFGERIVGCSPDGFVGKDRVVEVKTMRPDLLIALLESGKPFPPEHRAQCQGTLWITGRRLCTLKIFYRGFPVSPEYVIERDEAYIAEIKREVEIFQFDLKRLIDRMRKRGGLK